MLKTSSLLALMASLAGTSSAAAPACQPFPSSLTTYGAGFREPEPPLVKTTFNTGFIQHKWDINVSHITAGHIHNSPSKNLVRADQASSEGISSSVFNFANVTKEGLVDNTLTMYPNGGATPTIFRDYVNSNFPLFREDMLVKAGAVFGGLVKRDFIKEDVASWQLLYQGVIPVTVYVNNCNAIVGYDYFGPQLRTRVITNFFNIEIGNARM